MNTDKKLVVTTSVPLDSTDKNKLIEVIRKSFGKREIDFDVDPEILGGIILSQGSKKLDLSVNKRLENTAEVAIDTGSIVSLNDGVIWIDGLEGAMYGELLNLRDGNTALVMNLEEKRVGAVLLGSYQNVKKGDNVTSSGKVLDITVSDKMIGRVIDPMGNPLDRNPKIISGEKMPVERIAPGIVERQPVDTPLETGILAIDAMIPIGRGQRELIIGDRSTGKTTVTIDTIINQKGKNVICIYTAIGQKRSKIAQLMEKLDEHGALSHTIIVAASASSPASMRYLAPYSATAVGEYFMSKGKDVLVIYDDLTKHAWAYRELSLLLRRPTGREAYPGDVFYLHSRLLERACRLSEKNGGGSLTALPIIETQASDVSAYIPTNVISITDGQIYLEGDLFFAGIRPALNVGLSVSRVGGAAQTKAMKKVAGQLRLDLTQYWELATFAQFASETDKNTSAKIERGRRIVEILKQPQYMPYMMEEMVTLLYMATSGALDNIEVQKVTEFKDGYLAFIKTKHKNILKTIKEKKELSDETKKSLDKAIEEFKKNY